MIRRIKTNIKFKQGLDGVENRKYGFVTKLNGSWRGCHGEDECKKKIVFIDPSISDSIIPNTLYSCILIPMKNEGGFITISATLIRFKACIETRVNRDTFMVVVKFGNKHIVYDPSSQEKRYTNIQNIADGLRRRIDLIDPEQTAEDFISSACIVKRLYEQAIC